MKKATTKIINGPTLLTLLRIILVAPLMVCIFIDNTPAKVLAILLFTTASITDFIDGRWARATKQVTNLGAFLDPLADKMLINLTFLALVVLNQMPIWMFAVILVRDFAVDGMRMMMASQGAVVSASIFGKAKTMTQMFTVILILLNRILNQSPLTIITTVLLYIVVALTIFSGIDYLTKGYKKLK